MVDDVRIFTLTAVMKSEKLQVERLVPNHMRGWPLTDLKRGEVVFVPSVDQDGVVAPVRGKITQILAGDEFALARDLFPGAGYDCIVRVLGVKIMANSRSLYKSAHDIGGQ